MHSLRRDVEQSAAARQREPLAAGATGVVEKRAVQNQGTGLMGVAKNHHLTGWRKTFQKPAAMLSRFTLQGMRLPPVSQGRLWRGQLMKHVDVDAPKLPRHRGRELQHVRIDIAAYRVHGSNSAKLIEHSR